MLMKFSFDRQTLRFFFQDQDYDQDQESSMKFINNELCFKY